MAHHKMAPLINAVYKQPIIQNVNERGGLLIVDKDYKPLFEKTAEYQGGEHVEQLLLYSNGVKEALEKAFKVYLFTYFAPCNECTKKISAFPMVYQNARWYLAFYDWAPFRGNYTVDEAKNNLQLFHRMHWKVRQWNTGKYRYPTKLSKLTDLMGNVKLI